MMTKLNLRMFNSEILYVTFISENLLKVHEQTMSEKVSAFIYDKNI